MKLAKKSRLTEDGRSTRGLNEMGTPPEGLQYGHGQPFSPSSGNPEGLDSGGRPRVAVDFTAVPVRRRPVDGDDVQITVMDAALGDDGLRKSAHRRHRPAEHHGFQAMIMVDMNVLRGKRQFMVLVLGIQQTPRQIEFVVIVDVRQGGHAVPALLLQMFVGQPDPNQVTHGLRAVGVAVGLDEFVELRREALFE